MRFFLSCVFVLAAGVVHAAEPFKAKRYPFSPAIVDNRNPALCAIAVKAANRRFLATSADTKVEEIDGERITWLAWKETGEAAKLGTIYRLELDLDGTKQRQTVLYHVFSHSWRGDNHYAYVAPSRRAYAAAVKKGLEAAIAGGDFVGYYPNAGSSDDGTTARIVTGSDWQQHTLFQWRGGYYFHAESNAWGRMAATKLAIYRLRADGRVALQCSIQVAPEGPVASAPRKLPALASFLRVLSTIGDGGSGPCGTLNAGHRHNGEANAAIERLAYRPWAVSRANGMYFQYDARVTALMEGWSYQELWNRREYQTFVQHIAPAQRALERYLARSFGLDQGSAAEHAQRLIEELTAAWIMVPSSTNWGGDPAASVGDALQRWDEDGVKNALEVLEDKTTLSDQLHEAVEWAPGLAVLLAAGTDVDRRRNGDLGFGKTPLMTAAHLNRPDAVRLLLKAGARPNLATVPSKNECGMTIERGSRTALMYAAENAGPAVIKLLLDAGADARMTDSKGNGMGFYLARNPRFTPEEQRMEIRDLAQSKLQSSSQPGFDCAKAGDEIEKTICSNEVLRIFDGEMASAFARWKPPAGEDARQEQRAWLRERRKSCNPPEHGGLVECLQQITRARVRYLHNRLAE